MRNDSIATVSWAQEDPAPGPPCRRSVEMEPNMDCEWKRESGDGRWCIPCLSAWHRHFGTSTGRGFETSERGSLCHATILSFRPSPPLPPGKGYLGAKAQSKATLVGAALAFFVISASVSPLFRALMINTRCGQCSVSVVVDPRW